MDRAANDSESESISPTRRDLMRKILFAALMAGVADFWLAQGMAHACASSTGGGWTSTGGGVAASLVVLGGETCQASIPGVNLQIIAPPRHGKVKIVGPSSYMYTPNRAYRGPDQINVSAVMGNAGLVIGTIAVTVN
jgi:hypothetical protein